MVKVSVTMIRIFTGSVQQALGPLSQGPSEWRTWKCHLAEDPSSGSETNSSTEQRKNPQKYFK